ncbi:hypothetical protein JMJ35_010741 [Cladonia borealis]|uniref:EF-hand domain-containing protein n=1 Tax=Cladonia borealis TaxID=184061 RepID=A0AA39QR12_9LECA|nr:hypothetical protein JMJ35_010741 [Cladonia borealis]
MRVEVIALLALSTVISSAAIAMEVFGDLNPTPTMPGLRIDWPFTGCNKSCKPMDLPICWAWAGGYVCDNSDGSTPWSGKGGSKYLSTMVEDPIAKTGDPHRVAWEGGAMGDKPDEVTNQSEGGLKILPVEPMSEDDAAMHRAVDGHGKGFLTLNEFLRYLGETKTPELVDYFDEYDVNRDGVITPDEMRLPH